MKHLLILLVVTIVGYISWHAADKKVRRAVVSDVAYHAIRLGALVIGLLLLVAAAVYLPSSVIF